MTDHLTIVTWLFLQLLITATEQTSELLAAHGENGLLRQLKASAIDGDLEACSEISARLLELGDQLVEVCLKGHRQENQLC